MVQDAANPPMRPAARPFHTLLSSRRFVRVVCCILCTLNPKRDVQTRATRSSNNFTSRCGTRSYSMFQSLVTNIPGYVGEECLDVFRPLCRFVVEQESMLPHVHHQYWIESGY